MKPTGHIISKYILHSVCLLLSTLVASCSIRPDNVLSNKKMTDVLVDIHNAEGVLQVAGYNYGHDDEVKAYYSDILQQHGVTQAQFDSSIVWYTDHPQYFQRVYPKVIKQLQQRHDDETKRLTALDEELKQAFKIVSGFQTVRYVSLPMISNYVIARDYLPHFLSDKDRSYYVQIHYMTKKMRLRLKTNYRLL